MPWYYAGPDAQPVGPIALEELQARRANGVVSLETYVIEYVGAPSDACVWKRYKEVFPTVPALPPPVSAPTFPAFPAIPSGQSYPPLNSSAPPIPGDRPKLRANPWCGWGFGLGLASLILLLPSCGLTVFLAVPAFVLSLVGLLQVQHDPNQSGRNLAWSGLFLSGAALLITIVILAIAVPTILKGRGLITTTEQTSTDSE